MDTFIKDIMEDAIDNRLDSKEWPYCSQCPAVWNGSGAVSARQKPRANYLEDRKNGSKLIVFVIEGLHTLKCVVLMKFLRHINPVKLLLVLHIF